MSRAFTPFTPSVTELPHLAILSGSTTPFVRHEFSTRSSLSSTIHCASLASLFIPLPLPFFPFSSFSRRNNEMWKNGSSLLKSEHRPRSLLCLLFPFRPRGRRKMASGEYLNRDGNISASVFLFFFTLGRCFAFSFILLCFSFPFFLSLGRCYEVACIFIRTGCRRVRFQFLRIISYYESWGYSLHFGLAMRRVE